MLDLRRIRENRAEIELQLQRRGGQAALDELLKLDKRRRDLIRTIDALQHERKTAQELVAAAKRQGFQDTGELLASLRTVAERIRELEDELRNVEQGIRSGLLCLPNVPHPSVPDGSTAADNIEVRRWGEPQPREFRKDHLEIGRELNLLDFRRAAKVSGSGFVFYTAKGAQ
ncbi:MAG: serine--tRNA ligase, partial [Candidatus Kapabacteria bacterium]|nr:serine--tRNA ligase [Candidatus Kapabacteria bacterium]